MCTSPLWIKNRRYFNSKDALKNYKEREWDRHRLYISVPCGHCEECLKKTRADWFVRLDRELAYQRAIGGSSIYITITIKPEKYEYATHNLSAFIRDIFESIRRKTGQSIKHALFVELGGRTGRLHLHGFLFGTDLRYGDLHRLFAPYGFIWVAKPSARRARYVVKYIVKDISGNRNVADLDKSSRKQLRRKYVSAGVGNYLGLFPRPSVFTGTWKYLDIRTNTYYTYSIPRYYDKYKNVRELDIQDALSSLVSAHVQADTSAVLAVEGRLKTVAGSSFIEKYRSRLDRRINRAVRRNLLNPPSRVSAETRYKQLIETITQSNNSLWLPPPILVT